MLRFTLIPCSALLLAAAAAGAQTTPDRSPPRIATVLSIGSEADADGIEFYRISAIAVLPGGDFYVLDAGNRTVLRFRADGHPLGSFGREGSGPGEFLFPAGMTVDSLIQVFDARQRRSSFFTPEGAHRRTQRWRVPDHVPLARMAPLANGMVVGSTIGRFSWGSPDYSPNHYVVALSPGGTAVDTVLAHHSGVPIWYTPGAPAPWGVVQQSFGPAGAMAVSGDTLVALADGYEGTVAWYRAGVEGLVRRRSSRVPGSVRPVTQRDLAEMERAFRESSGTRGRIAFDAPPFWSVATRALFDDAERLWLENGVGGPQGAVWAVFGADGTLVRRLRLPPGFTLYAVRGPYLYGSLRTDLDVESVRVYRLRS
jgi:hypothetical protein